jgi:dienelactone hydrolase
MRPLALLLLAGCTTTTEPDPEPDLTQTPHVTPDLATAQCGDVSHGWVPFDELGRLVDFESAPELAVPAAVLQGVADTAGLGDLDIQYGIRAWRYRYTTQDRGEVVEATGLIGLPDTAEGPLPVALWNHHTMGFADACGPSGLPLEGLSQVLLAAFGYAVVAPDYLGMNGWGPGSDMLHPYIIAEPTAVASLDALRTLRNWDAAEPPWAGTAELSDDVVVLGGSEGGFASIWVHRYAPYYLADANLRGVVAFVPPTDLVTLGAAGVDTLQDATSGLAAVLSTAVDWYQEPGETTLADILTDEDPHFYASTIVDGMVASCNGFDVESPDTVEQLMQPWLIEAMSAQDVDAMGVVGCIFEENSLTRTNIPANDVPILIVAGEEDTLVVGATVRDSIPTLCDQGMDVRYVECAGAEHTDAPAQTLAWALDWAQDRLAGMPDTPTCEVGTPVDCTAL